MERKSAGLRARRMTEADLEPLHRLLSDPEVMRYLEPPFSREQTRAFLERAGLTPEPLILAVDDGGFTRISPEGREMLVAAEMTDPAAFQQRLVERLITTQPIERIENEKNN